MFEEAQKAVEAFHKKYGFPIGEEPGDIDSDYFQIRVSWMLEELSELLQAKDLVGKSDALADLIYYAVGTFVAMGIDGSEIFRIVQKSNMTKASNEVAQYEGGKPIKDIIWIPPEEEIARALGRMTAEAKRKTRADRLSKGVEVRHKKETNELENGGNYFPGGIKF